MQIALLTFDGFDEVSTFVSLGLLAQLEPRGWRTLLASPTAHVTSANGVQIEAQARLELANTADAVVFGSSIYSRAIADEAAVIDRLQPDPVHQRYAAQCGGSLLLARLGLLADLPAACDEATRPWLLQAGVRVSPEPFSARGSVATAGGPLAAVHLATWLIWQGAGRDAAQQALRRTLPVGDAAGVERVLAAVGATLH